MRKLSANYIFPISGNPLKNGIIKIDNNGTIIDIIDTDGELKESENLEFYNGILTPGFINTHCHIELSHLKNKIKKNSGLPNFILDIVRFRESEKEEIIRSIKEADNFMQNNGIVAVGDISNLEHSFPIKSNSKISYHTFIEVLGASPSEANDKYINATNLYDIACNNYQISCSLSPHAPYSVSSLLTKKIIDHNLNHNGILSIHNQESNGENLLFKNKSGELYELLKIIGVDYSEWKTSGKNSLPSILNLIPKHLPTLFIHNTFTNEEDLEYTINHFEHQSLFWSFCPRSNLFIENKLPNINLFLNKKQVITIGTDSLASNDSLSILEELKILTTYFPEIHLSELLKWATLNGAKALKYDTQLGSISPGKRPGINLISHIDFDKMKLTQQSMVKKLI